MLTSSKKAKLQLALKAYCKKYLSGAITELDESGTRLLVNHFLIEVLGFRPIEEIKTEYMIRGTYADYMIQLNGERHFLVEVKALSLNLSDKHLRQAINYGANEGIEWALLTNGKKVEFYKILFNKPIEWRKVISVDLCDTIQLKEASELLQYLHRDSVLNKGLTALWNKSCALDPSHIAGLLYAPPVSNFIKKTLRDKFRCKFSDEEVNAGITRIIAEAVNLETVKPFKSKVPKKKSMLQVSVPHEPAITNEHTQAPPSESTSE